MKTDSLSCGTSREKMGSHVQQQSDEVLELEEVEEMEEQVKQIAERIGEFRATVPDQLKTALSKVLAAQRPILVPFSDERLGAQSGPSGDLSCDVGGPIESGNIAFAMLAGEEQKEGEKVQLLKQKISENASAIPVVMNRVKQSMARIDKLQTCNGVIHPAFKRKWT